MSAPHDARLEAVDVTRAFSGVVALDAVSLSLRRGEVLGLLGPNGAGKSTLVNLLTGFDQPTSGSIRLDDGDISNWSPARRGRAGLARTFQHGHSFANLSVRENIEVAVLGVGQSARVARGRADELLDLLHIGDYANQLAGGLPHGAERLLGVARALATDPRFVLLDEPAAGLNEDEATEFGSIVEMLRDERNLGVLLIDHNIGLVFDVCDSIFVLDQGKPLMHGTAQEVREHPQVMTAYLGTA